METGRVEGSNWVVKGLLIYLPDDKPGDDEAHFPHDAGIKAICCLHHQVNLYESGVN